MLRLPPFELLQPATLAEALELKMLHGEDAMYTSGGTDLYPNMKRRQFEPHSVSYTHLTLPTTPYV